jgi:hypothetical protein
MEHRQLFFCISLFFGLHFVGVFVLVLHRGIRGCPVVGCRGASFHALDTTRSLNENIET